MKMLDAYYRAGGSILWVPFGDSRGGLLWNRHIGSRYDVESFDEALQDSRRTVSVCSTACIRRLASYIWTTNVASHPVTADVKGLFLPRIGEWSWPGTVPMRFGKSWQVVVRGMEGTRSVLNANPPGSGREEFAYSEKSGAYPSEPEVVGVRDMQGGSGRMMVFPLYITYTWANFGHPGLQDAVLLRGDGVHPSDGFRLLINAYRWLAEPARKAGMGGYQPPPPPSNRPDLSPLDWSKMRFAQDLPQWKGLIGAQTAASGGSGSVGRWVAEAKKLGLSYLIFLEDPARLTPQSFEKLLVDCKAETSAAFAAIPGFRYRDVRGILRYNLDVRVLPTAENIAADGRIKEPTRIVYQHSWRVGAGFAAIKTMPIDPWWNYVTFGCAPFTFRGPKLVDDGMARYLNMEVNSMFLLPISLVEVRSPEEMADSVGSAYLTVFRARSLESMRTWLGGTAFDSPQPCYLTNGPRIDRWAALQTNGAPFRPGGNQLRIGLSASSPAGLQEVKIIDATDGSLYRRFDPQGAKHFAVTVDENQRRQWNLCPVVTDGAGKTAIGPCLNTMVDSYRQWCMGDRLMGMSHVTGWDEKRETLKMFGGGIEISYHKGIPGAGEEPANTYSGGLKIQGIDGGNVYSAACKVRPRISTDLGGEPTQDAFRYNLRLASHDVSVTDYVGDTQYAERDAFTFNGPPRQTLPTRLANITSRLWAVRSRWHAPVSDVVYEVTAAFKQNQRLKRFDLSTLRYGEYPNEFDQLFIRDRSGTALSWLFNVGDKFSRRGDLPAGGYVYQAHVLGGAMGFVPLDEGLSYDSEARGHSLFIDGKDRLVKAGEKITARFLIFHRPYPDQTNNAWLEKYLGDFGIGRPPAYEHKVFQGRLRGTCYFFDVDSADGGAVVEIRRRDLPHNLPLRVFGLSAAAVTGQYDLQTKQVRMLPVFEGCVASRLEINERPRRLYVGELLRCDQTAARLSLVPDGANFLLEIHNPTREPLSCCVQGVAAFAPLADVSLTLTVAPGTSQKRLLTSRAGAVTIAPWREM